MMDSFIRLAMVEISLSVASNYMQEHYVCLLDVIWNNFKYLLDDLTNVDT